MSNSRTFLDATIVEISAKILVGIILAMQFWLRNYLIARFMCIWRYIIRFVTRKPYVVVWTDLGFGITDLLSSSISRILPKIRVIPLKEIRLLERFPKSPSVTKAFVLIVTDVTKLSDNMHIRKKYQTHIEKHVLKGGGVFGGHDLIYRRTRNEKLQEIFGGRITDFRRIRKPVNYIRRVEHSDHPISNNLPDGFQLGDGEIIFGNWAKDAKVLYDSGRPYRHPLIVARTYGRGKIVWSNSADCGVDPPKSIAEPEEIYVKLITASIKWFLS